MAKSEQVQDQTPAEKAARATRQKELDRRAAHQKAQAEAQKRTSSDGVWSA